MNPNPLLRPSIVQIILEVESIPVDVFNSNLKDDIDVRKLIGKIQTRDSKTAEQIQDHLISLRYNRD